MTCARSAKVIARTQVSPRRVLHKTHFRPSSLSRQKKNGKQTKLCKKGVFKTFVFTNEERSGTGKTIEIAYFLPVQPAARVSLRAHPAYPLVVRHTRSPQCGHEDAPCCKDGCFTAHFSPTPWFTAVAWYRHARCAWLSRYFSLPERKHRQMHRRKRRPSSHVQRETQTLSRRPATALAGPFR